MGALSTGTSALADQAPTPFLHVPTMVAAKAASVLRAMQDPKGLPTLHDPEGIDAWIGKQREQTVTLESCAFPYFVIEVSTCCAIAAFRLVTDAG